MRSTEIEDIHVVAGRAEVHDEVIEQIYELWKPKLKIWRLYAQASFGNIPVDYEWWRNRFYDSNPEMSKEVFMGIWKQFKKESDQIG